MRAIRKRIATGLQASLLALVAGGGCTAPTPPPSVANAVGVLLLPAGTNLARDSGGQPLLRPATNLALLVEQRAGASRVLAADGTHGWTATPLPGPSAVTVECTPDTYPLFDQSPDDVLPEAGDSRAPTERAGALLGASRSGYPSSQKLLLAPPWLRVIMPALHVRCGVEGYSPPEWLSLNFQSPTLESVQGIVRRPFTRPFQGSLVQNGRPGPQDEVLAFLEDQLVAQPSGTNWADVEAFYRDADNAAGLLTVYGSGAARLIDVSQPKLRLYFSQYEPYLRRVVFSGGEWFIEVVSIYGDGAYSTLFHITRDRNVVFHRLSRSSGELDDDVRATWGLLGGELFIARASGADATLVGAATSLYLAQPSVTSAYSEPLNAEASVFPMRSSEEWITGIPFRTEAEARQRAAGGEVLRYPR